jgi:hypothetical protein
VTLRLIDAAFVPSAALTVATTVTSRVCVTPLVVSVLFAHRRFVDASLVTIAMQPSLLLVDSARSTASCGRKAVTPLPGSR